MDSSSTAIHCWWPKSMLTSAKLMGLVTKHTVPNNDEWKSHPCTVIKSYDSYLDAHLGAKRRSKNKNYETEKELGIGLRKKTPSKRLQPLLGDEEGCEKKGPKIICSESSTIPQMLPTPPVFGGINKTPAPKFPAKSVRVINENTPSCSKALSNSKTMSLVRKNNGSKVDNLEGLKTLISAKKLEFSSEKPKASLKISEAVSIKKKKTNEEHEVYQSFTPSSPEFTVTLSPDRVTNVTNEDLFMDLGAEDPFTSNEDLSMRDSSTSITDNVSIPNGTNVSLNSSSQLSTAVTNPDFEAKVLRLLHVMDSKIENVVLNQAKLNLYLLPNEKVLTKPPGTPGFPICSMEDVETMEKYLNNEENFAAVCVYFSSYVSKKPECEKQSTRKILENLMGNCVAKHYSFKGQRGKQDFFHSLFWRVLKGALTHKFNTNLEVAENTTKSWLKDAEYRNQEDGGPSKRKQQDENNVESEKKKKNLKRVQQIGSDSDN